MKAMRCKQCEDVRWSFMGLAAHEPRRCTLCGGEMVPERRHPHRGPERLPDERREHDDVHDFSRSFRATSR
jgi:hypothetical protein